MLFYMVRHGPNNTRSVKLMTGWEKRRAEAEGPAQPGSPAPAPAFYTASTLPAEPLELEDGTGEATPHRNVRLGSPLGPSQVVRVSCFTTNYLAMAPCTS